MAVGKLAQPISNHLPIFPRLIVDHLVASGFTEEDIFRDLNFAERDLASEGFRLDSDQHEQFIKRAINLTNNLHLALDMKDRSFDATSNAVLILFATSGRISNALRLITRYNHIYTRTLTVGLEELNSNPILVVDSHLNDERVNYFAVSSFVLFIDNFFMDALASHHLVMHAELAMAKPMGFDDVRNQFGFDMRFDCERTRVFLDPRLIDKPLRHADPQTTRLITEFCENQLVALKAEVTVEDAVKALVYEHISAPPTLDQAASMIGLSSRSLRRQLQRSATSYKSILNDARRELSVKLLLETDDPISSIAYEVGFEHPSHFGRAFKKWTGQSPSDFRKAQ